MKDRLLTRNQCMIIIVMIVNPSNSFTNFPFLGVLTVLTVPCLFIYHELMQQWCRLLYCLRLVRSFKIKCERKSLHVNAKFCLTSVPKLLGAALIGGRYLKVGETYFKAKGIAHMKIEIFLIFFHIFSYKYWTLLYIVLYIPELLVVFIVCLFHKYFNLVTVIYG